MPAATTYSTKALRAFADKRYPSPSAQWRGGEQWRVRLGLIVATLLTVGASAGFWQVIN